MESITSFCSEFSTLIDCVKKTNNGGLKLAKYHFFMSAEYHLNKAIALLYDGTKNPDSRKDDAVPLTVTFLWGLYVLNKKIKRGKIKIKGLLLYCT